MTEAKCYPLAGLRVVDLSTEIAGPYATKLLVDAGAEVIKVESPEGDPLRRWTASHTAIPAGADGALFQYLNASKHGVVADLSRAADRELVSDLAARADVVVESAGPGVLQRLGLGYDTLRARNAALSLVSISPWGQTGPWANRPATEWTLQAAVGSTAYRGLPARGPVGAGGRLGEWATGIYAALGAMFAWLCARRSGTGQHVDVSMFEAIICCLTIYHDLDAQLVPGPLPQMLEIPSVEPAKDGWVGFCTYTAQQWKDFCVLMGRPDFAADERLFSPAARMQHIDILQPAIHAWTRQHTVDELIASASRMRIPAVPIGNGQTVLAMDHFAARGVFVDNPAGFRQPRVPYRLERCASPPVGRAPRLDEHAAELRAEIARTAPRVPVGSPSNEAEAPFDELRVSGRNHLKSERGSAHAELVEAWGGVVQRAAGSDTPTTPLAGLRVVDLTGFWAGPSATALLADMGADVIKVESVQRPDGMRLASGNRGAQYWEQGFVFLGANVGKRDVTLRLDCAEGVSLLKRLLKTADVLAESFSARVMEQFGLSWEVVRTINPRLIMLRMPAFGLDGPWRDRPGFAPTVEQVTGLSWMTGYEDLPLIVRGVCDPVGGMHAVFALLLALEHRHTKGEGQLVEVPLVEPGLNIAAEQVIEYTAYGQLLSRQGNRGPYAAPQGVYPCAQPNEYLALAVATDEQWLRLCTVIGRTDWAQDPELSSAAGRRVAHDAIDAGLRAWLARRRRDEAVEQLVGAGIPAHAAINAHELMPNPQLEHRRFFQVLEHPYVGRKRFQGLPMRFSALGPDWHRSPPPTLGQHNAEVLGGELGLSADELARLRRDGIIGERPAFQEEKTRGTGA